MIHGTFDVVTTSASPLLYFTTDTRPSSAWVVETTPARCVDISQCGPISDLTRLSLLEAGWDGEDAPPPSSAAILAAREIILGAHAVGLSSEDIEADVLGGVAIWYSSADGLRRAWIACMNTEQRTILYKDIRTGTRDAVVIRDFDASALKRFIQEHA